MFVKEHIVRLLNACQVWCLGSEVGFQAVQLHTSLGVHAASSQGVPSAKKVDASFS